MLILFYQIFATQISDIARFVLALLLLTIAVFYIATAPFGEVVINSDSVIISFFRKCFRRIFCILFNFPKRIYVTVNRSLRKKITGKKCTAASLFITVLIILIII